MKYVALLRGINVGGNNIIKMTSLKACFEKGGFQNVLTYIQSGNVIFESKEKSEKIVEKIEKICSKTFNYTSKVVIRSLPQMKKTVANIPKDWLEKTDIRCNLAFIKEPATAKTVAKEVELREDVDSMQIGDGVLYISYLIKDASKSKFPKLAGKKIYKDMTIRNLNTTKKLLALMEQI